MTGGTNCDRFSEASQFWEAGDLKAALRLFLENAKAGDVASQLNIGYFYDRGLGVRRNTRLALQWYRRAYQNGDASAANNIGTIYRDRGNRRRALEWFLRAFRSGNVDSSLEIAKLYLAIRGRHRDAKAYLRIVIRSNQVTAASAEEAHTLLRNL